MTDVNHSDRAHSEIGASSAKRWLACPASVSLSRGIEDTTSAFAEEGTAAHELAEECFKRVFTAKAEEYINCSFNGYKVDQEMAKHVQYYLDAVHKYDKEDSGYDVFIEQRFELTDIHPDMFGSNDFCAFGIENGEMVIADFKYGAGLNVLAEENIQMIYYALGAYFEFDHIYNFKTVKMIIIQPRIEGCEYDEWVISIDDLLGYIETLKRGVNEVYAKDPKIEAGDHCKFCKAKPTCPELKLLAETTAQIAFEETPMDSEPNLPTVTEMDLETISKVLTHEKLITDWMKSVRGHAKALMEKGIRVPNFKLVAGRGSRKLTSEHEFELAFGEDHDLYEQKLKGITALEKLIGKEEIAPYFTRVEGAPIIAKANDRRKEIIVKTVDDAFAEIDYKEMEF